MIVKAACDIAHAACLHAKRVMGHGGRAGLLRFAHAKSGAAAVEFALVAVPFLALLFAIIQTALVFFAGQSLEYAVAQSSRLILTGQAQGANLDQASFKTKVCEDVTALFDCANKLQVNVQDYSSFAAASTTPPYDSNGQLDTSKLVYQPGGPGDIVVVSLYYQWPIYVRLLDGDLSNQNGNTRLLIATAAFRNEPYQ
jgi:Flp pilus assembly protein TadG